MEKEGINQTELATRLGISKSRVSQILNGDLNCTLKKLVELCLSIGIVPKINYTPLADVLRDDTQKAKEKNIIFSQIEELEININNTIKVTNLNPVNSYTFDSIKVLYLPSTSEIKTIKKSEKIKQYA